MANAMKKAPVKSENQSQTDLTNNPAESFSRLWAACTKLKDDIHKMDALSIVSATDSSLDSSLFYEIIRQIPDLIYLKDIDGRFLACSEATARYYGAQSVEELIGKTVCEVQNSERAQRIFDTEYVIMTTGDPVIDQDEEIVDEAGVSNWIQTSKVAMRDADDNIVGLIGVARDITEQKRAERTLDAERVLYRAMIDQVPDYLFVKDTESRFVIANRALAADLGRKPADLIGRTDFDFHKEKLARKFFGDEQNIVNSGEALINLEEMVVDYSGARKWFSASKAPLRDYNNQIIGIVGVCRDITARKHVEDRVHFMAMHDSLTRLPNRTLLVDRLEQGILQVQRTGGQLTALFIDLDNFKIVNDSLGHNAGDSLIKAVGERLASSVRASDTVARLGGDEFVILLVDQENPASHTTCVIDRIRSAIADPFIVEGQQFCVTCSIGAAKYPDDGTDAGTLLINADIAMYQAKEDGRNNIVFYTRGIDNAARERRFLQESLQSAVANNELTLVYQPQVDLKSGEIFAVEALARWHHPDLGDVSPAKFIPLAEDNGLIVPLGDWVLREACRQNKAWQETTMAPITVCVNVSTRQVKEPGWVERVKAILSETGLDPQYLELEITESMLMHDVEQAIAMMRKLREIGVNFAIDDFGTGYSSLSALNSFPVTRLKLDQSFIRDLAHDNDEKNIAEAVVSLGQKLNMRVIAEGVETREQIAALREIHCDEFQGYYFSKPVGAEEVVKLACNPSLCLT